MNIRKLFGLSPKQFSYIVTFLLSLDGRSRRSLAKRAAAMGRWMMNPLFPHRTPCFFRRDGTAHGSSGSSGSRGAEDQGALQLQRKAVFDRLEQVQVKEAKLRQILKHDLEQLVFQSNQVNTSEAIVEERMQARRNKLEEYQQYGKKLQTEKDRLNERLKRQDDAAERAKLQQFAEYEKQLAAKTEELHRLQDEDNNKLFKYGQKQQSLKKTEETYTQMKQKHAEAEAEVKKYQQELGLLQKEVLLEKKGCQSRREGKE